MIEFTAIRIGADDIHRFKLRLTDDVDHEFAGFINVAKVQVRLVVGLHGKHHHRRVFRNGVEEAAWSQVEAIGTFEAIHPMGRGDDGLQRVVGQAGVPVLYSLKNIWITQLVGSNGSVTPNRQQASATGWKMLRTGLQHNVAHRNAGYTTNQRMDHRILNCTTPRHPTA